MADVGRPDVRMGVDVRLDGHWTFLSSRSVFIWSASLHCSFAIRLTPGRPQGPPRRRRSAGPALAVGEHGRRVDAQQVVDRGQDVLGGDPAFGRVAGDLVGPADDPAAGDAAAGHHHRVASRPVVAAAARHGRGDPRRPAVLAQEDDQGLVEQPAPVEIHEQARERPSRPGSSSSFIRGKWSQWVSQPVPASPYSSQKTVTNRPPASTSRRAVSEAWPKRVMP